LVREGEEGGTGDKLALRNARSVCRGAAALRTLCTGWCFRNGGACGGLRELRIPGGMDLLRALRPPIHLDSPSSHGPALVSSGTSLKAPPLCFGAEISNGAEGATVRGSREAWNGCHCQKVRAAWIWGIRNPVVFGNAITPRSLATRGNEILPSQSPLSLQPPQGEATCTSIQKHPQHKTKK